MSVLIEKQIITPEEYLTREAAKSPEDGKSEYFDGEIYDMPIVSDQHDLIVLNFLTNFSNHLRKIGFSIKTSDVRVKLSPTKYALPDVTVVRGKPIYNDDEFYNLLNPHLIVEVLSDNIAHKDRGVKFNAYRQVESLMEYVMVSQYEYLVETYFRNESGNWEIGDTYASPDEVLKFKSIPLETKLKDIYDGVEFGKKD